jgi:hypothetical protein
MHKVIDIRLTSVFSPICQALIHESLQNQLDDSIARILAKSRDLLVVRQDNTVIGYALFELTDNHELALSSLYFRNIVKDHSLGEFWLSRLLKRYLKNSSYHQFLLAS